jgi:hypothetical protein
MEPAIAPLRSQIFRQLEGALALDQVSLLRLGQLARFEDSGRGAPGRGRQQQFPDRHEKVGFFHGVRQL